MIDPRSKNRKDQSPSSKTSQQNPLATKRNVIEIHQITLPKGGGAIKSIADPVGIEDNVNLYMFLEGNPIIFVDPEGKGAIDFIKKALERISTRRGKHDLKYAIKRHGSKSVKIGKDKFLSQKNLRKLIDKGLRKYDLEHPYIQ